MFVVLLFIPFLPESPMFLHVQGRYEECEQVLERMIRWNQKKPMAGSVVTDSQNLQEISNKINPWQSVKILYSRKYVVVTLLLMGIWFVNSFCYYGVVVMTPQFFKTGTSLSGYIESFITSAAELPGVIVAIFMINSAGRKKTQGFLFLFCGIFLFLLCIPTGTWLLTVFAVGARMCVMGAFSTTYVFTSEVFPTVVRSTGMGVCSSTSRIAGIITSFVAVGQVSIKPWVSLVVYAVLCIVGAAFTFAVPVETNGKRFDNEDKQLSIK
ncbi:6 TM domain-containing transmembrane protein [Acrasis kona]|uniref:6 TM domain-containing transmembrane protein n=1 Tax=Acrasis kona TaxID=1008807 RepID=A0AAW2ZCA4_9EUKA